MVLLWAVFLNALMLLTKWLSCCHGAALAPKQWRTSEKSILTEIQSSFTVTKWRYVKSGLNNTPMFIHTTIGRALIKLEIRLRTDAGNVVEGRLLDVCACVHDTNGKQRGTRKLKGNLHFRKLSRWDRNKWLHCGDVLDSTLQDWVPGRFWL